MGVTRNRKQTDALAVLISICLLVALTGCGKKEERPLTEQAFYEEALVLGDLTQEEKAAIEELLKSSYIEDEESAGFCFADAQIAGGFDLAGRIAELASRIPDYDMQSLRERYSFLVRVRPDRFKDPITMLPYARIARLLDLPVDWKVMNDCLQKWYDSDTRLFFAYEESVAGEINLTYWIKDAFGKHFDEERFGIKETIRSLYTEGIPLLSEEEEDVTYTEILLRSMVQLDQAEEIDWEELAPWIELRKGYYDSVDAGLGVGRILCFREAVSPVQEYGTERLYDFYRSLTAETMPSDVTGLGMITDVIRALPELSDAGANREIEKFLDNVFKGKTLSLYSRINVQETVYGVILAEAVGFPVDKEKILDLAEKTIHQYTDGSFVDVEYVKTDSLRHAVLLERLLLSGGVVCDAPYIQNRINEILEELTYENDSLWEDFVMAAESAEIVSALRLSGVDISLDKEQTDKIKTGLEKARADNGIVESSDVVHLAAADEILGLNLFSEAEREQVFCRLESEGGYRYNAESPRPDMGASLDCFLLFLKGNQEGRIDRLKDYVQSRKKQGLFSVDGSVEFGERVSLQSTAAGYAIQNYTKGEKQDD